MTTFSYMLLTSLCFQYVWGIEMTNVHPIMEPFNKTHCKIFYETSFKNLPKTYTATLMHKKEEDNGKFGQKPAKIVDNFVKFPPCLFIKKHDLSVSIAPDGGKVQAVSEFFTYNPANVKTTIEYHGCMNSDGTLGGEVEVKRKNKFYEMCFKKMEIVDKNTVKEAIITVNATFFLNEPGKEGERNETVAIKEKELGACGLSDGAIAVVAIVPILVILVAFAAYFFYRRDKDIMDNKEERDVNPMYGEGAFADYDYKTSEVSNTNDYYEAGYSEDSKVTDQNDQYRKNKNKNKI